MCAPQYLSKIGAEESTPPESLSGSWTGEELRQRSRLSCTCGVCQAVDAREGRQRDRSVLLEIEITFSDPNCLLELKK